MLDVALATMIVHVVAVKLVQPVQEDPVGHAAEDDAVRTTVCGKVL